MGSFVLIRPRDDGDARQASDWADSLEANLNAIGHTTAADIGDWSPANTANISAALSSAQATLICYFGHGDKDRWLTAGSLTADHSHFTTAKSKAVVSIACKTGCNLGSDAITAGVES